MKILLGEFLVAAVSLTVLADETADPRVRTYVDPVRVVWTSSDGSGNRYVGRFGLGDFEALLRPKLGQIPEREYCAITNRGNAVGFVLDFGREIHGGLQIATVGGNSRPVVRLRFGESVAETFSDALSGEKGAGNDHALRDFELMLPICGTIEVGNTGFRFVRVDLVTTGELALSSVRAVSLMRPMVRLGSFRCSDERLNRIFETAVRTVHLCCQDKLWDGIKRDRLVWMGDVYPETMSILAVFGAASVLPESFDYMVASTPPNRWMNNIGTYTLWFVRNLAVWYRYTGDREYLRKHAEYLKATMANVASFMTPSNTLEGIRRPFIDWPTEHNRSAVRDGVQALALLTFRDAAFLAKELGDGALKSLCVESASRMERLAGTLGPHGSKQAAALLALAGLESPEKMFASTIGADGHAGVSTFYGYFMLEAMSAAGEDQRALDTVRDYWGAMLDVGATSFWEDFNLSWTNNCFRIDELPVPGKNDIHGDYGEACYRGYRQSLCHGWSAGPAAWLINHVLGIRPTSVGCKTHEVKPFLGDLDWAEGAMALPDGRRVFVRVEKGVDGHPVVRADRIEGWTFRHGGMNCEKTFKVLPPTQGKEK